MTKRLKDYLIWYTTKEYDSTTWVKAVDKYHARSEAHRVRGRRGIQVFKDIKDIDRIKQTGSLDPDSCEWVRAVYAIAKGLGGKWIGGIYEIAKGD